MSLPEENVVRSRLPPQEIPNICVGLFLKQYFEQFNPEQVALINTETGQQLTYGQLNRTAAEIAAALLTFGVDSNDRALFYAENSLEYYQLHIGLSYLGGELSVAHILQINGTYELHNLINDFKPTILVISNNKFDKVYQLFKEQQLSYNTTCALSSIKLIVVLDEFDNRQYNGWSIKMVSFQQLCQTDKMKSSELFINIPHFSMDDPANTPHLVLYTSGSTGTPKGVIHSHRSFVASIQNLQQFAVFRDYPGQAFASTYTLGHISGILFVLTALCRSMTVVMLPTVSTKLILESIERYQIAALPITLQFSVELHKNRETYQEQYDLSSLKIMMYGSTKYPPHVIESLKQEYNNVLIEELYGSTEAIGSVANTLDTPNYPPGSLGRPLSGVEIKIIDLKTGHSLPKNQQGEICFRGPNNFIGYLNNLEATKESIDSDGWYHTGDAGYFDQSGHLFMVDRIKEMNKYKVWTVIFAEIEGFLYTHQAVEAVCAVGVPHKTEGCHLRAYVQLAKGMSATESDLVDYVKQHMGYQNRLNGGVRFVQEIPRTAIGKVHRPYFKNLVKDELLTEPAELE